jgi:pimeloyl-ACP methyl ester carboxylesterase
VRGSTDLLDELGVTGARSLQVFAPGSASSNGRDLPKQTQRLSPPPLEPTVSRPVPAAEWRTVVVEGARVRLMEVGRGEPLLFLHGWGLSPRAYRDGVTRLSACGVRVLAPALPGFGGSDGPPLTGVDLDAYADRIAALLDSLQLERPAFVVGHSLGGGVAIRLATRRPDLVRGLTLVNAVGGAPPRTRQARGGFGMVDGSWTRWIVSALAELEPAEVLPAALPVLRDLVPNLLRKPVTAALSAVLALRASLAEEAAALVTAGVPVLFVWGDRDRLIAPGTLGTVTGGLPSEVVRGRHGWLLRSPQQFAELLHNALVVSVLLERRRTRLAATS